MDLEWVHPRRGVGQPSGGWLKKTGLEQTSGEHFARDQWGGERDWSAWLRLGWDCSYTSTAAMKSSFMMVGL
eukprot:763331-Hanusia_phi.AAC.1